MLVSDGRTACRPGFGLQVTHREHEAPVGHWPPEVCRLGTCSDVLQARRHGAREGTGLFARMASYVQGEHASWKFHM